MFKWKAPRVRSGRRLRWSARSHRVVAAVMVALLVWGQVPTYAWAGAATAESAASAQALESATPQSRTSSSGNTSATSADSTEATGQEPASSSADASKDDAANQGEQAAQGAGSTTSNTAAESSGSEASSTGSAASSESPDGAAPSSADASASNTATARTSSTAASTNASDVSTQALTSNAKVLIQDSASETSSYSQAYGSLSAGTVLWANLYDGSSSWSLSRVDAEDGWTYQWYAASEKSSDKSDYAPIEDATGQSLTVTEDLAGSYIIVCVTVDGIDRWAPLTSYGDTINQNYLPGPVLGQGQAELYSVTLSNSSPSVGEMLTATANVSYNTPAGDDVNVTYTWQQGDSRYGTFEDIEGAGNGPTFTLTEAQQGKYVRVIASAGVNEEDATTSDTVMAEGAVKLAGVELATPGSLEMPVALEAKAYTGSSYSPTYVTEGVTYTWMYAKTSSPSYSTTWTVIEGETGPTLTVDSDEYAGCCFRAQANAGANDVEVSYYNAIGPVKLEGQVDIYTAFLAGGADATSGSYVFTSEDTAWAFAREQGGSVPIDSSKVTYQWQMSTTSRTSGFEDIEGATGQSLELAKYEGCYVRCVITANVGGSTYTTTATMKIAAPGSVNVTSVSLDASGKVNVGATLTATASAASGDVTDDTHVTWAWYYGDSSSATDTKIEGATGNTLELTQEVVDEYDLLGKYVEARADGGFGEEDSSAVGPLIMPGAVELYRVEVTGDARIGSTLTATAYKNSYSTVVSDTDTVTYQWQYATTNTTSDAEFTDIPGATGSTYTIPKTIDGRDAQGLYLRVQAVSDGSVVSTYQRGRYSYSGSTYVDPAGPVMLQGQYTLSSVELSSSGQGAQAGATITPAAQVRSGYYDVDAPTDAQLTYTWYIARADGSFEELDGSYDPATGVLALTDDMVGATLKVSASALDNTVTSDEFVVVAAGTYDLACVSVSPSFTSSSTTLFTDDAVSASVWANGVDGYTTSVTGEVAIRWYVDEASDGSFDTCIGEGAEVTLPAEAAGCYLKVVATSGASTVEAVSANPVVGNDSLAGIVAKLDAEDWRPEPVYGEDTNVNDVLQAKLAEMGVDDVDVRVTGVTFVNQNEQASLGVSTANDATNGDITFFFIDPDVVTGFANYTQWRQLRLTFELSRDGETAAYTPGRSVNIPWDEARVGELLEEKAADLAIGFASGDASNAVTGNLTLPYKLSDGSGDTRGWSSVSWSSDSDAVRISGYGWSDYTGTVTRTAADQEVALTATIGVVASDGPSTTIEKTFTVTVLGDPALVEAEQTALQEKVDAAFTADALTYSADGAAVDPAAVVGDLQLPRPSAIGIDGADYTITYTASTDAIEVNGYRGNVYQPLPDADGAPVELTLTVTSKANPEITASKTIQLTVAPLEAGGITSELALMEAAKAGYGQALLGENASADAVTTNLHAFQKAYLDENSVLTWAYDSAAAGVAGDGIVATDLPGYDPMGSAGWRLFRSSNAGVVAHESLVVTQPTYNTEVTITSVLTSEKYARYAERYADDETWGLAFSLLANQEVSTTFTVLGTSGEQNPSVTAAVRIVGVDASGADEAWVVTTAYELTEGSTAADLTEAALADAGLAADYGTGSWGWYLNSITSADGRVLEYDEDTGKYWQLFVNGAASDAGAGEVTLQAGDEVTWYYSALGASLDDIGQARISVTASVIGPDADGEDANWVPTTRVQLAEGSTAAELTEELLTSAGLEHEATGVGTEGYYLSTITSIDGRTLGWDEDTGCYWQLFVNGSASDAGAGQVTLKPGDEITWYYSAQGAELPTNDVEVDPDAPRPDYDAAWPTYAPGAVTDVATPTEGGELAWSVDLGTDMASSVYASDPIVVNGNLYLAVGDELRVLDAATGKILATATLATSVDSACRLAYADGLVVVPLHGGRLQALTADTLTTVSLTDELAAGQQALSTLTISDGRAYFGTTSWTGETGTLFCVELATGAVVWSTSGDGDAGYYWCGAVLAGDWLVAVDGAGVVRAYDPATGEVAGTIDLGANAHVSVVADDSDLYVVTNDGTLHRLALAEDGSLTQTGSVRFADSSTSTPTIADGRAYVGGANDDSTGVLAVIDLATMGVEHRITGFSNEAKLPGDVKSAPTVSVRDGETYVYFTCNEASGGAYLYRLGDDHASVLYMPAADQADWCTASVIVGADGSLYYVNDSGTLFKLKAGPALPDPTPTDDGDGTTGDNTNGSTSNTGDDTGNVDSGDDLDGGAHRPTGTVQPGRQPIATGDAAVDEAADDALAEETSSSDETALSAGARVSSSADAGAAEQPRSFRWLPIAGIILGVCGLVVIIVYVKRRERSE